MILNSCIPTQGRLGEPVRKLAEINKVSVPTMVHIIDTYRLETSNNEGVPTEAYIKAKLGNKQYVEPSEIMCQGWEKFYSKPLVFDSIEEMTPVKNKAEQFYAGHVVTYEDNNGKQVLIVEKPVEKLNVKHRKDFNSWQAYNDYLLAYGDAIPESQKDREERKIGPQPFTFNDGIVVTAPFQLNEQQEAALNEMSDFVKSDSVSMTLSGYAGTGKTSLMELLAHKLNKERVPVIFSASTNKAAAILRDRVRKAGYTAQTLNKVFGIQVTPDETKPYDADNLVTKIVDSDIKPGTVVVIDEASMINETNYKILNDAAKAKGLKIIYVGDKGQLAPINERQVSKVFRDKNGKVITLTKVERTEDNAILKEATAIRNGEPLSQESSFNEEGKGVAYIKPTNREGIKAIVEKFVPELKKNPDFFRIIAYTNDAVSKYNTAVRNALGYTDNTPHVGEPIVGYHNWGYVSGRQNEATYKFVNSESYKVVKVGKAKTITKELTDGRKVSMQTIPVTIEDALGNTQEINMMDIKGNEENRKNALILAKEKARLWNLANSTRGKTSAAYRGAANDIEKFLFVNDNIEDPDTTRKDGSHPTLQNKVFDFGYAMTTHKSQGSTFTHVLVDDVDIAKAKDRLSVEDIEALPDFDLLTGQYVDRSQEDIDSFNEKEGGDFLADMNSPTPMTAETINRASNNRANIRQQLEYVAVSRATDTVTIISDKAKKEDTPLNHIKESSEAPSIIENTSKTVQQMNSKELWEHLESLAEPMGERPISYTPVGKTRQEYIVKDSKVYNKKGEEVHYQGKDINRILANLAVAEDRGVVVTYRDKDYVVDNHQTITSVTSGDIMKWGSENGDRKAIIQLAEQKFKTLIKNRQNRLSEMVPELMDLLKAQGINVNDKAAMEKFLKENPQWSTKIQQAIDRDYITDSVPFDEKIAIYWKLYEINKAKRSLIQTKDGLYLVDHSDKEDLRVDEDNQEVKGFQIKFVINTNGLSNDQIEEIKNGYNEGNYERTPRGFENWLKRNGYSERLRNSDSIDVEVRESIINNARLDTEASQGETFGESSSSNSQENRRRGTRLSRTGANGDIFPRVIEIPDVMSLITSLGELYGFVDPKGELYFDEEKISPNVQIHEYTHLWDRAVAERNPKLWKRGVDLMKQTSLWNEVLNNPNYGKKWQALQGITNKKLDSLIASEVHAKLTGTQGEILLNRIAKEKGAKGIVAKLKQWMLDFWKELKGTFSNWSDEEINNLTLDDFNKMTVRDLIDKVNLKEEQITQTQQIQQSAAVPFVSYPLLMENLGKETGERLIQVDTIEKEAKLIALDKRLGENTSKEEKQRIIAGISDVVNEREGIRVTLPNYQKEEINPEEPILVDQEWKIPLLQELDAQITDDITPEEEYTVLDKMENLLHAISQEDYEAAPTTAQKAVSKKMLDYKRLNRQRRNLIKNTVGLAPSEIRQTAEQIVDSISDVISEIQKDPKKLTEYFPTASSKADLSKATRKDIVKTIGINALIDYAKQKFENLRFDESNVAAYDLYDNMSLVDQAELIVNNWEAMLRFASDVFVANEGFGIKRNTKDGRFEANEREYTGYDYDNYVDPQDEDALTEEHDEQEYWQVVVKTIDVMNSMSDLVRQALHECYLLDEKGNKILSKFGIPLRVDKKTAVNQILRWTQGTMDINQMISKLESKRPQYPWLNQLIIRLKDSTGNETDFQSQFYGVMHRHFQLYSIGQKEKGKYVSKVLNSNKVLADVMDSLSAQYQMYSLPLFTAKGLNQENFKKLQGDYATLEELIKDYGIRDNNGKIEANREFNSADIDKMAETIKDISNLIGYQTSVENIKGTLTPAQFNEYYQDTRYIKTSLEKQSKEGFKDYDAFDFNQKNGIRNAVRKFLKPLVEELADTTSNALFEDGKMYQNYVIPSFLSQLFDNFKKEGEDLFTWMEGFYGQSKWFKKNGEYRVPWLQLLNNRDSLGNKARESLDHMVQLTFNKHSYMQNLSPEEYTMACFTTYFSGLNKAAKNDMTHVPAWFRVPIQSNKPSNEYIKFIADMSEDYKNHIIEGKNIENQHRGLFSMYLMELSRIDTVRKRAKEKNSPSAISSFDENGKYFQVLTFLNSYITEDLKPEGKTVDSTWSNLLTNADGTIDTQANNDLKRLLNAKLRAEGLSPESEAKLIELVKTATRAFMEARTEAILSNFDKSGILKAAEEVQNIKDSGRTVREALENFIWNDFFAANNILMMTVTDKAFYEGSDNLQKRLSELHAPGNRGNKFATDYEGKRVSDGFYRTIILKDFKGFMSNIIDNISTVFDKMIETAPTHEKAGLKALKEELVGKDGRYRKINVTDAQAYNSISSYRKKAFIFGKWSKESEKIYNKLYNGEMPSFTELKTVFQPLKPFVYGHVQKNMGVENAPIHSMPVPFQAKNAEYLLVMADALLRGQETGKPNLLKVISDVMEESEKRFPTKGIDTIQFDSAIKSGGQGLIDIGQYINDTHGEASAKAELESQIYIKDNEGNIVDYNYDTFVHMTDYDNFALQQEVPKHFQEHEQAEPSQMRMNIPTDLDYYNYAGEINQYTWKDDYGKEHSMDSKQIRKEWEDVHAANIEERLNELAEVLKLNSDSKKERNIALSELLLDEIESSPRYGVDLMLACEVDDATGELMIPKGDPIQAKRIEQLINSIIKNRVNKQKIAGGPIVQVSNFGTSKQLHIRFNSKEGGLLLSKEEFEASGKEGTYDEYKAKNQAGIAYFEVFAPASMKALFEKFQNPDGSINFEAVEKTDPELLKMITGRIPNEDKYSIAHAKIVGFLPAVAGEAIMFPYELTEIDDSDFDVDKRYCQRKVIYIEAKDREEYEKELVEKGHELYKKQFKEDVTINYIERMVSDLIDHPDKFKADSPFRKSLFNAYQGISYKTRYPKENTTEARNNQIIDMSWAIMSNEMTAPKILNPGGFEIPKKNAYVLAAYRALNGEVPVEKLEQMDVKALKKLTGTDKDLAWFDAQVQYYKQNAAGSNLIGVFAVNKVAHATLEGDGIIIDIEHFCGENPIIIADTKFEGLVELDAIKDSQGNYIGKTIGQGIGASADTAKDPWLDLININMTTAGTFNTMLRMGMPWNDAALFMSQDAIVSLLRDFNRKSLEGDNTSLDTLISDKLEEIKKKEQFEDESVINKQPLSREELRKGLLNTDKLSEFDKKDRRSIDYKVLLAFSKLRSLSKAIKEGPTVITRQNSMSAAVGPLIIDNIILEHKLKKFLSANNENGTGFKIKSGDKYAEVDTDTILALHPILKQFARTFYERNGNSPSDVMFRDMPAGSTHFRDEVLAKLPSSIKERIYDDRALLSKLSDFYQSYMLIANGFINPQKIGDYINKFPEYFLGKGTDQSGNKRKSIKEQYPNNAFIQAIQPDVDKKTKRGFLKIDTTGMLEQEKERLRMAWADLHKSNPELSTQLFTYAFFRGGVGFSPKTWMSLVPTYVKENLRTTVDGRDVSYIDTYRHFPTDRMVTNVLVDQFVRNNWNNNTLAPIKGGEGNKFIKNPDGKTLVVHESEEVNSLKGIKYMRTKEGDDIILWRLSGKEMDNQSSRLYVRIEPLGNNGEFIEMSLDSNIKPLIETKTSNEQTEKEDLPQVSPTEQAASQADTPTTIEQSDSQIIKNLDELAEAYMKAQNISMEQTRQIVDSWKQAAKEDKLNTNRKKQIHKAFTEAGAQVSEEEAVRMFKKLC